MKKFEIPPAFGQAPTMPAFPSFYNSHIRVIASEILRIAA
jgi:hypothetical protein